MNFKSLALASVLAVGSIFGSVGAAEARPSQCWSWHSGASSVNSYRCDVTRKVDSHGTWRSINYDQTMIRLYDDGTAQLWWNGGDNNNGKNWFLWRYDDQGDIRITDGRGNDLFAFRR